MKRKYINIIITICIVFVSLLVSKHMGCNYMPLQKFFYERNLSDASMMMCSKDYFTALMFRYDEDWLLSVYDSLDITRKNNYEYGKYAILSENNRLFKKIVDQGEVDYFSAQRNELKNNFLHDSVNAENMEITRYLDSKYPHLKYEKNVRGNIPLHYAILIPNIKIIKLIADEKSMDIHDENGFKAYQRAAFMAVNPDVLCLVLPENEQIKHDELMNIMLGDDSAWTQDNPGQIELYLDNLTCK